jgi:PAS domain S-box-containing protein
MPELEHIKSIYKTSPSANIILHNDGPFFKVAWVNPAFLVLAETEVDELIGKSVSHAYNQISKTNIEEEADVLRAALAQSSQLKIAQKAGTHCNVHPILDELDQVLFLVLTVEPSLKKVSNLAPVEGLLTNRYLEHPTHELILQLKQIDAYHQKMSNILESITDGFYAMDKAWTVTYWNKEAERILQKPREAMIGKKLWEAYPKETHAILYSAYQSAMSENNAVHFDMLYQPMNTWMEISVFPSEEGLSVYFKDITDRKQIEVNLLEAKKQYQELFDFSPLPQWVYDIETFTFKDVNHAAVNHYGYSKEEFLSMNLRELKLEEDYIDFEKVLKKTIQDGFFHKTTTRHVKKNGDVIDVNVEGNSITFEGKSARLVLAIDVTEKLSAEHALKASEQKFKALVQDGSDLLAILDNLGNYLYVNQSCSRILSISPDHFIGKNAFDFIHNDDKDSIIREFGILAFEKSVKIAPYRFKNGKGEYRWIETVLTNMIDDPAVGGVVSNSRDVTDRIMNEQKIQESIDRFNMVSKATSDAIWDFDRTTNVVVWNEAASKLFGYKETILTPNWWEDRIHPDDLDRVLTEIRSLVKNKVNRLNIEFRFRCADGVYKTVQDRSFLLFNEHGALVRIIGSMQDVTDRVMYVQKVEEQNLVLKEIAWTQAHVVRAPLARIMGIADLLSAGLSEEDSNKELITYLTGSATELDDIIREIIKKTEMFYKSEM